MAKSPKPKKKNSPLAAAASRKLARIGGSQGYSPEEVAHAMLHAEERGDAERITLENGGWAWRVIGDDGQPKVLVPTPEMLEALDRFAHEGHPAHDE